MEKSFKIDLARLKRLDPETISTVHREFFPEIYRYAWYRLGDQQAAEDLAAEVLLKLIEAINHGQGPEKSLRGWLMGTASNLINDYYRKSYSRPTMQLDEDFLVVDLNPLEISEEREETHTIQRAIQQLTPDQQHVIALRFGGGYSLVETANMLGKNVNAIKALQFRAISALRREIEKILYG
jgi:RNA polymerase sigma-70 factor (ECF subfamily)